MTDHKFSSLPPTSPSSSSSETSQNSNSCNSMMKNDSESCRRPTTLIVMGVLILQFIAVAILSLPSSTIHSLFALRKCPPPLSPTQTHTVTLSDFSYFIQRNSRSLFYVPSAKMLFLLMPKAGTSTTLRCMYAGLTGDQWQMSACGNAHNHGSDCWKGKIVPVVDLDESVQLNVLTDDKTFRFAVQREPFARLLSGYKDKFSCKNDDPSRSAEMRAISEKKLGGHRTNLRQDANATGDKSCMNISEFAGYLDAIRLHAGEPGFARSVDDIDHHLRPQKFHFDKIEYDVVLDSGDLSNTTLTKAIFDRLPFPEAARNLTHFNPSKREPLVMDEVTARRLHIFANLSMFGHPKYILR